MPLLPGRDELLSALEIVRAQMPPTPTIRWPLLEQRLGATVCVKHENHTALGAFKLRGGAVYLHELLRREPQRARRHQRHARQPRPVDRARRGEPRPERDHRRAARQLGGEERRDARAGRDADRARRRLPASARTRRGAGRRPGPAHGAQLPPRPGARRGQLLDRVLRAGAARRGAGADRPGLGHLRLRRGAGLHRRGHAHRRRGLGPCHRLPAIPSAPAASSRRR